MEKVTGLRTAPVPQGVPFGPSEGLGLPLSFTPSSPLAPDENLTPSLLPGSPKQGSVFQSLSGAAVEDRRVQTQGGQPGDQHLQLTGHSMGEHSLENQNGGLSGKAPAPCVSSGTQHCAEEWHLRACMWQCCYHLHCLHRETEPQQDARPGPQPKPASQSPARRTLEPRVARSVPLRASRAYTEGSM